MTFIFRIPVADESCIMEHTKGIQANCSQVTQENDTEHPGLGQHHLRGLFIYTQEIHLLIPMIILKSITILLKEMPKGQLGFQGPLRTFYSRSTNNSKPPLRHFPLSRSYLEVPGKGNVSVGKLR